nr:PAS domain S-box protein [Pseudomonas taiwanensis]
MVLGHRFRPGQLVPRHPGLDPHRPLRHPVNYIQLIPEDDRVEVLRLFREVLDGRQSERAMRHRIRGPDGTLHWLEISGSLQPTTDGRRRMIGVIRDVTQQQQRAQGLATSRQRYSSLFHLSPDVVLLVRLTDSLIVEANQDFEHVLGWPVSETIGRTTLELSIWVDLEQREWLLRNARNSGAPISQEVKLRTRNGGILDGVLSSQYIELEDQPFAISTFLDTTARKRAENALCSSEEKFAKAFRSTPDAVVITDRASGCFMEVNVGFERQFGWSQDETIGHSSLELGIWEDPAQRHLDGVTPRILGAVQGDVGDHYLTRQLQPVADAILPVVQDDFSALIDRQLGLF